MWTTPVPSSLTVVRHIPLCSSMISRGERERECKRERDGERARKKRKRERGRISVTCKREHLQYGVLSMTVITTPQVFASTYLAAIIK